MAPNLNAHEAAIYEAAWWVRHYRPQRSAEMRARRRLAIRQLGLVVREAFNSSDNFEPLLSALFDALSNIDRPSI